MKTLLIRTLSGAIYVATIILPLLLLPEVFPLIIAAYGVLAMIEYYRLTIGRGLRLPRCRVLCSGWVFWIFLGTVWLLIPFGLLAFLPAIINRLSPGSGEQLTIVMFVLVWTHDTFAYLTGRAFGKRPLAPGISPAKTVEGAIGGALFAFLGAFVVIYWFPLPEPGFLFWPLGALAVVLFANLGDLAESKLKRLAGVKDSGTIMPGHGGIFDRFDAILLVVPCWIVLVMLFA
ncbi:MAG: phosphatidate cytidylyltransferase [Bacteroidales bacterium]